MKYSIKLTFSLVFTFVFAFAAHAQNSDWIRIESENKEISFAVPDNFSFYFDKKGFTQPNPRDPTDFVELTKVRSLTAYKDGATMIFESYDVKNAKKALPLLRSNHQNSKIQNISFENFSGLQIFFEQTIYSEFYYLASDKNIYFIGVGARKKDNEVISKFLNSIKLNNKTVFNLPAPNIRESDKILSIIGLQENSIKIESLSNLERKELEKKQKEAKNDKTKSLQKEIDNPSSLAVLFKPRASYTDRARQNREQGLVVFRVDFQADGKIGKITVVKDLKYGLTEEAIRALKRLRFIPAEKDNAPIDLTKTVEYSFTIY